MSSSTLKAATRSSPLAIWQTEHIGKLLGMDLEIVPVESAGDKQRDVTIEQIGGRGVFVKEVQAAVLDRRADIAVHSAKDLMSTPTPGLALACIPERGDVRDALIGKPMAQLPPGASVATGSVRRRSQLANLRPDLLFSNLRGNTDTRLGKAKEHDAIVMAHTAIVRLGRQVENVHVLEPEVMLPQVGQGALAVECREDDKETIALLQKIEHEPSRRAVDAERSFLATLGGGCDLPVAAYATIENDTVFLRGLIASMNGQTILRARDSALDGVALGKEIARKLLEDYGGNSLLSGIRH